uniref:Alpha-1,3/1,6-mannosyltransferase ALG2 n=1 Tax=Coccolithus braarudii TaxID=221442 RepID=A0A7S0LPA1_9EUKA
MLGENVTFALAASALFLEGLALLFAMFMRWRMWWAHLASQKQPGAAALRVCFLHPDLGIGGAERLVVDAAVAAQTLGHDVTVFTAHHDSKRCLPETRDGTLRVAVVGGWLVPMSVRGRLVVACANARSVLGAIALMFRVPQLDVVVIDQVSASVPLFRLCGVPVLFYCHFPDKLLVRRSSSSFVRCVRGLLRIPFDLLEEVSIAFASRTVVNSLFTAGVYHEAFPLLRNLHRLPACPPPGVLYPAVDTDALQPLLRPPVERGVCLLSINRFEAKKGHMLALAALKELAETQPQLAARVRLVFAGGYDERLDENVSCLAELRQAASPLGSSVEFWQNVSNEKREALFKECAAVVYTPSHEHFGIVPVEAMAAARPVIAVNNGGPCESVLHGSTGWLCEPTPQAFAAAFAKVVEMCVADAAALDQMGVSARAHVVERFSHRSFAMQLDRHLRSIARHHV